jgi:hypothetical protein
MQHALGTTTACVYRIEAQQRMMALRAAGDDGTVLYFGVAACQADGRPLDPSAEGGAGMLHTKGCRIATSTSDGESDGSTLSGNLGVWLFVAFWGATDLDALPMRCRGFGL